MYSLIVYFNEIVHKVRSRPIMDTNDIIETFYNNMTVCLSEDECIYQSSRRMIAMC